MRYYVGVHYENKDHLFVRNASFFCNSVILQVARLKRHTNGDIIANLHTKHKKHSYHTTDD